MLSEIAKMYDPLGLLVDLKRLMKYLWIAEVGWDPPISEDSTPLWRKYHEKYLLGHQCEFQDRLPDQTRPISYLDLATALRQLMRLPFIQVNESIQAPKPSISC